MIYFKQTSCFDLLVDLFIVGAGHILGVTVMSDIMEINGSPVVGTVMQELANNITANGSKSARISPDF